MTSYLIELFYFIEIITHELSSNDQFIVLGTDGIWDFITNERVNCFN